jgi:hypothetical protein
MKAFGLSIIRTKQIILYPLKWFSLRLFNNKSNCLLNDGWMWNSNFGSSENRFWTHSTIEKSNALLWTGLDLKQLFWVERLISWDNFAKASSAFKLFVNCAKKSSVFWMKITVFSEI